MDVEGRKEKRKKLLQQQKSLCPLDQNFILSSKKRRPNVKALPYPLPQKKGRGTLVVHREGAA